MNTKRRFIWSIMTIMMILLTYALGHAQLAATIGSGICASSSGSCISSGSLVVKSEGTLNVASGTVCLSASGTPFVIDGTCNTSNSTFEYVGTGPQTITANPGNSSLVIDNATGVVLDAPIAVSGTLTLASGTFNIGEYLTLGNGATIIRSRGSLSNAPLFGTTVDVVYNGTSPITTGPELPTSTFASGPSGDADVQSSKATTDAIKSPSASSTLQDLTICNSGGVTLNAGATVNDSLKLVSGKLSLGTHSLIVAATAKIAGASASNYVVTDNAGKLKRNSVGSSLVSFPIGTNTTYNPVTINNTGTADDFSISVKGSFDIAPNDPAKCLTRQWTISEATPGGSNATITLQFNASDPKGELFDPAQLTMYIGRFPTGGPWVSTLATKGGSDPYTVSASFTTFSQFAVSNDPSALPIQLTSFAGNYANNAVHLAWTTISEINNYGFFVERKRNNEPGFSEIPNSFIAGHGTTYEPHNYSFTDQSPIAETVCYRLRQVDLDGAVHFTEPINVRMLTSVKELAPIAFAMNQNFPNPFNPETNIKFSVEQTGRATLEIYTLLGQKVVTLFDDVVEPGYYQTVRFDGANLASGVYLYRLQAGSFVSTKKMLIVK